MSNLPVSFEDVAAAAARIRGGVFDTPLTLSRLGDMVGCQLHLKHEVRQATGSFKERGARNAMQSLEAGQRQRGVIAASAGNHALALAYHGRDLDIPVTVVMPLHAPQMKANRCRDLGAMVIQRGDHLIESKEEADRLAEAGGLRYINGYDDPAIIAGAGTVGMEIVQAIQGLDAILVPVGGGGLIAGIALAVKALKPSVRVIGVEAERVRSMQPAIEAGKPIQTRMSPSLADGLAVSVVGSNALAIAREQVDEMVTVDEHDIALAILRLVEVEKTVCEGAGAAGVAALLAGKVQGLAGKQVATVLCGGNIDTSMLGRILQRGLAVDGRLARLSAIISDRPGGLARFAAILAEEGASIVDITHDRVFGGDEVASVAVLCTIQTRDQEHIAHVLARLDQEGISHEIHEVPR